MRFFTAIGLQLSVFVSVATATTYLRTQSSGPDWAVPFCMLTMAVISKIGSESIASTYERFTPLAELRPSQDVLVYRTIELLAFAATLALSLICTYLGLLTHFSGMLAAITLYGVVHDAVMIRAEAAHIQAIMLKASAPELPSRPRPPPGKWPRAA